MSKFFKYILLLCMSFPIMGQVSSVYPEISDVHFNQIAFDNPAHFPSDHDIQTIFNYRQKTGAFNTISGYNFLLSYTLKRDQRQQLFRLLAHNERDGPYISRPRAYLNYAYRLTLSSEIKLALGYSMGIAGSNFDSRSNAQYSDYTLDGTLGIVSSYKNLEMGLGVPQLFNTSISPFNSVSKLPRYVTLFGRYELKEINSWHYAIHINNRIFNDIPNIHVLSIIADFRKIMSSSVSYRYQRGLSFYGALSYDNDFLGKINFGITYNSPFLSGQSARLNSFEASLGIFFNK